MLNRIKQFFLTGRTPSRDTTEEENSAYLPREKALVFVASILLAFCLWFIVNLSRDFSITIELPLEVINLSADMALVEDPPSRATVGVTGEGWKLIALYSNPPRITVDLDGGEVNLYERVQQQVSALSEVTITQVQPLFLNLEMEQRMSREVPLDSRIELQMRERFGLIGEPLLEPETVTIQGAASRVEQVDTVYTRLVSIEDVKESRELEIYVERPGPGITVSPERVLYRFEVAEFTEAETRVPIRIRNLPSGRSVTYNPSSVTVRYDVSIEQYNEVLTARPFTAYVDYDDIESDTTGLVSPVVERTEDHFHIRLRSYTPRSISYFNVVRNGSPEVR